MTYPKYHPMQHEIKTVMGAYKNTAGLLYGAGFGKYAPVESLISATLLLTDLYVVPRIKIKH